MKSNYRKRLTEQQEKIIEGGKVLKKLGELYEAKEKADIMSEMLFYCIVTHMENDGWGQTRLIRFMTEVADMMDQLRKNPEKRKEVENKLTEKLTKGIKTASEGRNKQ